MKPTWIFEEGFNDDQAQRLADAAKTAGCEVVRERLSGSGSAWRRLGTKPPMIVYGSIGFLRTQSRPYDVPWAWLDLDNLKCSAFMAHWGKFSIHRDYAFFPYREVVRRWEKLFGSGKV